MSKKYKIGVLFCGGCNCYFDREPVYEKIKSNLESECEFEITKPDSEKEYSLILLINGCQSECLVSCDYRSPWILINNKNYMNATELIKNVLV